MGFDVALSVRAMWAGDRVECYTITSYDLDFAQISMLCE